MVILLITNTLFSQDYNKNLFLKDYSGEMIITTQIRGERNKAILRGTEADRNREFVLNNPDSSNKSVKSAKHLFS